MLREKGANVNHQQPIVEKLLTYKDASKLLGVTERTVWTLVNQGELPAIRFGRTVRIDPVDLRGFIDRAKSQCQVSAGKEVACGQ